MKKLKIYLDTSVISHLNAEDVPEKMETTIKLWEEIRERKYEIYISDLVFVEIKKCSESKKSLMLYNLDKIQFNEIEINQDIKDLAQKYIDLNILSEKHLEDALHIAAASISDCDILLSWNFKHIVRVKTIFGANGVNRTMGYKEIQLLSPDAIVGEEEE